MLKKLGGVIVFLSFYSMASSELERTVTAHSQLLTDSQQKITELQSEVDELRGKLEETSYQLNQTIERQKLILQQVNTISVDEKEKKIQSSQSQKNDELTLKDWSPSGNDKSDYNIIISYVLQNKEREETINALQKFLKNYPKSVYLANVNYWLGQLFYKQNKKDNASFYYSEVIKNYPKSAKAAESLYKIGLILLEKGDNIKSELIFQQVINRYPNDKKIVQLANNNLISLKNNQSK